MAVRVRTLTFARSNVDRQTGLTLVELLLALSIMSLGVWVSAGAFKTLSPRIHVEQAAQQIINDLKSARLRAVETNELVNVIQTEQGYAIEALSLERSLRDDLEVTWDTASLTGVSFSNNFANPGARIEVRKQKRRAVILIHPITSRIEKVEP